MEQFLDIQQSEDQPEKFDIQKYHSILCDDVPHFIYNYASLNILSRLDGVGLLCGTDWTPLYKNRFYYSRLNHSIGTALIVWNFTHDKKQTLAALLHDVSTPAFSHANDFRNGDALKQESTEALNQYMIVQDIELGALLNSEGLYSTEVKDYHKFPVADNDMPRLSADRLEYMFPSGAALDESWTMEEIEKCYKTIRVLRDENGVDELGFVDEQQALLYTQKFLHISLILQHNENKLTLNMMGDIIKRAIELGVINENDLYRMSEEQLLERFTFASEQYIDEEFMELYSTFRSMKKIIHSNKPVDNAYNVSLDVKQRYIDPLVLVDEKSGKTERISKINKTAADAIKDFFAYKDTKYGSVKYID